MDSVLWSRSLSHTRDISGFSSVGRLKDENDLAIFIGLEKASLMIIFSMRFHVRLCSFIVFFVHCEYFAATSRILSAQVV